MQKNILLNLSHKYLTNKDVPVVLTALANNPHINQLDLSFNLIEDQGIKDIVNSNLVRNIFYCNLYNNRIGDEGALAVVRSSKHNNIASLNLSKNCISARGIRSLAYHLRGSKIVNLDIIFNPGSADPTAFNALLEGTKRHVLLQYLHVPNEFNKLIRPVLLRNRHFVSRTKRQLVGLITDLTGYDEFDYPMDTLNINILVKFQVFYNNQMLNGPLIELCGLATCKKIQNYINDHYFKITGVVRNSIELDDANDTSIADLPLEVLSKIAQYCAITDVKVEKKLF